MARSSETRKTQSAHKTRSASGMTMGKESLQDHSILETVGGGSLQHGSVGHLLSPEGIEGVYQVGALAETYAVLLRLQTLGVVEVEAVNQVPSPVISAAISTSMTAASEVPAETSIRALD